MGFFRHLRDFFVPHRGNHYQPHLFQLEIVAAIAFLAIMVTGWAVLQPSRFLSGVSEPAAVLAAVLTNITNTDRAQNAAQPLVVNSLLTKAAQIKADDMALRGYFSHVTPEGALPWSFFKQVGYDYRYAGENLAVNFFDSAAVATAWMNSPTHRANMINPRFTEVGFGVAQGRYEGKPSVFVVEFFGSPMRSPASSLAAAKAAASVSAGIGGTATTSVATTSSLAVVAPASVPGRVLGMTTDVAPPAPTLWQKIIASPRTTAATALGFALIVTVSSFFLLTCSALLKRKDTQSLFLLFNGLSLSLVLIFLIWFNHTTLTDSIILPSEAAAVGEAGF